MTADVPSTARVLSVLALSAGVLIACGEGGPRDAEQAVSDGEGAAPAGTTGAMTTAVNPCAEFQGETPTPEVTISPASGGGPLSVDPPVAVVSREGPGSITWINDSGLPVAVVISQGPRRPPKGGKHIPIPGNQGLQHPLSTSIVPIAAGGQAETTANAGASCGEYKYSVVAFREGKPMGIDPPIHVVF